MPTSPGDQQPDGRPDGAEPGPRAERDPWAAPPPGSEPVERVPYPVATPWGAPHPRNGMGVSALVLGITGVLLSLFIVLFWLAWLPALLALIFGGIGLSQARKGLATNRGMALTGVILGVAGLLIAAASAVFTAVIVDKAVDHVRAKVEESKASDESSKKAEAAAEKARHLAFGEAYTFTNGLKVTVGKPGPFTPDEFANGHAKDNKAIEVTVTVVNTGAERVRVETGLPDVSDADGATAELVIDGSGRQKVIDGYVLPGRKAVGTYAFSLPPKAAGKAEVAFSPDALKLPDAYWSGALG
ncbi:DUF4190 domain-containing protein [Streptomyces benahoarensis]|uniref:DUF4190 domain-containing protein n=1 Tax=Streptomyces benahoarensis TaxID=2595054 RepID=A0A553Z5F6_9ACTN|nr:DUF4190 domain-containing protein [Streptomyces benahoarensis]TSB36651.1 DUF4190 domain-containing protein [Streptomyces benahoarensis]